MTPPKPGDYNVDQVERFKLFVWLSTLEGAKVVEVPTDLALAIVSMLERTRKPRGRQRISGRARVQEGVVMAVARRRKAELIAAGMSKGEATAQAAEEAAAKLSKTRLLSVTTIKRRMQRRR